MGVALERTGVRIEGVGAVEFGDLADVTEIVIGEFVEHLGKSDRAHFVVLAGAGASGGGNGMEIGEKSAAKSDEFFKVTRGGFLLGILFGMRHEFWQAGMVFKHDELGALLVETLDDGHVSEDFKDGPAIGGRLPLEDAVR